MAFSEIKSDFEEAWLESKTNYSNYWGRTEDVIRAAAGKSYTHNEYNCLKQDRREPLELPLIKSKINFFSGYMRDNIKSVVAGAQEEQDQETADELSTVLKYVWDKGDGLYTELDAFDHSLYSGLSLMGIYQDYTSDIVNGDIRFFMKYYNSFVIDPNWSRLDLKDAGYVILREFVTRDEAKLMLPEIDPKIIDEVPSFFSDNKFNLLRPRENLKFTKRNLISFDSFYRQSTRKVKVLIDLDSGEEREITDKEISKEQMQSVLEFENQRGSNLDIIDREKPSIEYNIILSGEPVFTGRDPVNVDSYPFVPVVCYFHREISDFSLRFQGIAHNMYDLQRTFNKRNMRIDDWLSSKIDGGIFYKPTKLVDTKAVYQSGNYKNIPVKDAATPNDFWPIQQGTMPNEAFQFLQTLQPLFNEIPGVNDSVFGQDEGGNTQVSGHLAQVRIAAGLRANRAIFDNFEKCQKLLGSIVTHSFQNNYSIEKITRILGKEPTDKFKMRSFEKFDTVIKQNVLSQTQRDSYYFELLKLRELLGPEAITNSMIIENLPMVGKSQLLKDVEVQQQAAQEAAKKQAEIEQLIKALQVAKLEGENLLNDLRRMREVKEAALTRVKISEVEENMASATLDRAKAIQEIQKISDDRLMSLIIFLREMEKEQKDARNVEIQETIAQVNQIKQLDMSNNLGG